MFYYLAELLGRTVEELLYGSPNGTFRPLSASEMTGWLGYKKIEAWETQRAIEKAKNQAKGKG